MTHQVYPYRRSVTLAMIALIAVSLAGLYQDAAGELWQGPCVGPALPSHGSEDVSGLPKPRGVVAPGFFGLHIHRAIAKTPWPNVPFGSWRLWNAGVSWPALEPQDDVWQFEKLDGYVDAAVANKVEILLPLGLSPTWASARPTEPSGYSNGNSAEPADLEKWRDYVRTVATRYKGRIRLYEIWNEPNFKQSYTGSVPEMVALAREAYSILKGVDPRIRVVSPAPAEGTGLQWLGDYLSKGGGRYLDIVGYHFYVLRQEPEAMVPIIVGVRSLMAKHGLRDRMLWNTETGWIVERARGHVDPTTDGFAANSKILTPDEAAAYVGRSLIVSWASGVSRFYWYAWDNVVTGLVEPDWVLKPAAIAYRELQTWTVGSDLVCGDPDSAGTWICRVDRGRSLAGLIAWNPRGAGEIKIPAGWTATGVRDLTGGRKTLGASDRCQVPVNSAPLFVELTSASN